MVERKLYKTKLCALYQKGHCPRQSCSFAHGDVELRRFLNSYNGRRDHRDSDLRDKLDRRHSPLRRHSPPQRYSRGRDTREQQRILGYSPSRSPERNSERKHRRRNHFDGQTDFSGSPRVLDGIADRVKEGKPASPNNTKAVLKEQLKKVLSDINVLDHHKSQLEVYLEEKVQEEDTLSSRHQELEAQLYKENEECKRIMSKIRKFVKAHNRHTRIQDELKRSQIRLQKLGEQLGSDTIVGANDEDLNINFISDVDNIGLHSIDSQNELQNSSAPSKKRSFISFEGVSGLREANFLKGEERTAEPIRSDKRSRWNAYRAQPNNGKEFEAMNNASNVVSSVANESKRKRGKSANVIPSADKLCAFRQLKGLEMRLAVRSTSMAAQAVEIEEDKVDVADPASIEIERGPAYENAGVPFLLPPPPPLPPNNYTKFRGEDDNVDVDGLEEDMIEVDII